jgi:hypothetical protein
LTRRPNHRPNPNQIRWKSGGDYITTPMSSLWAPESLAQHSQSLLLIKGEV